MTRTCYTLADLGGRLGWAALSHFVTYLGLDSALALERHQELAAWSRTETTNAILADIYDTLANLSWGYACANRKPHASKPKAPRPYPRPWVEDRSRKVYGKDPIPICDFERWWAGEEV